MLEAIIGILLLIAALFWLGVTISGLPPGGLRNTQSGIVLKKTWWGLIVGSALTVGFALGGFALLGVL